MGNEVVFVILAAASAVIAIADLGRARWASLAAALSFMLQIVWAVLQLLPPILLLSAALAACAPRPVRSDLSANEHRTLASRERLAAAQASNQYDAAQSRVAVRHPTTNPDVVDLVGLETYNPTARHLSEAAEHSAHARQHERVAKELEKFEDVACRGFRPAVRAACPMLGSVIAVENVARGVRLRFAPDVPVDAIFAHMRCHLAYALAKGFAEVPACPLYIKDIDIRLAPGADGIDVLARDSSAIDEIRKRTHDELARETGI
jgi:hypothetical protein